jgi:hypothetical protein
MLRKALLCSLFFCVPAAVVTADSRMPDSPTLTAEQIVNKNVEARGGLRAWREIQTMTIAGKMDAGGKQNVQLPFVMRLKRPRMSRLEIDFAGKTALQVYDGKNGWKVRPFLGRSEVEPYTAAELEVAAEQAELDGLLIDHEAKGIKVELTGEESVEGHDAYKLKITMRDEQVRHLWVDAHTFLEVKIEGFPRKLNGKMHSVETYYRNYASVGGLMIPFVLETVVEKVKPSRKITIETVTLNPILDDRAFAKPEISGATQPSDAQVRSKNEPAKEVPGEKVR